MTMAALRDRPPLGLAVALLAMLLPWLTWLSLDGRARPNDVTETPQRLLCIGTVWVVALAVGSRDRWLGVFVAFVASLALVRPSYFGDHELVAITAGAAGLVLVRALDADWRGALGPMLGWAGAFASLYAGLMWFGVNPLGVAHAPAVDGTGISGTFGYPTYLGAYLALTAPLAPGLLLPAYALGLAVAHSTLATVAALVGLAVRFRARRSPYWSAFVLACGGYLLYLRGGSVDSLHARLRVWQMAITDLWPAWWLGRGFGAWNDRMIPLQLHAHCPPVAGKVTHCVTSGELFDVAHNEYLQLAYSGGLVALGLLCAWLWSHRTTLTAATPAAGAAWALAITCAAMFPLRLAAIAATAIVVLGLATAEPT